LGRPTTSCIATEGSWIAERRWDYPPTHYRLPSGRIRTGVEFDDKTVPRGTLVFLRH